MNFLIDPYVLALPANQVTATEVEDYLYQLQCWSSKITRQNHKFWMSRSALDAMWDGGIYPTYTKITKLYQGQPDIELFDSNIVSRACEHILQDPPYIEEEVERHIPGIQDVLIDDSKTIIIPEKLEQRLEPIIAQALKETLSFLTCARETFSLSFVEELLFATRALDSAEESIYVKIWLYMDTAEQEVDIESTWVAIDDPEQLEEVSSLENFWTETDKAVQWAYEDLIRRKILDPKRHILPVRTMWRVGKSFNESITKSHFDKQHLLARIFYTVTKILVGYWPKETNSKQNHALVGTGGQLERSPDKSRAWRAYVTQTKPKIRLHYWRSPDDRMEFSVIVVHENMTIE